MALGILIVLLIVYTSFLIYREWFVFFKKNVALLNKLNELKRFENVWCVFSTLKIVTSGLFMKAWLIPNGIILIDNYSFDLNKTAKQAANTYLLTWSKKELSIDKSLFRNVGIIENLKIMENGKIKIQAKIHQQSAFKSIGFYPNTYELNIEVNLPLKKNEIDNLLEKNQLL